MPERIKQRKGLPRTGAVIKLPDNITWLKQSNFATLMSYDYSVLQMRALISVIERLQKAIEVSIAKKNVEQTLDLFTEGDRLRFSIPIKEFGVLAANYNTLKDCLTKLATLPVVVDGRDPDTGKDCWYIGGLLEAYLPLKYERNVKISVHRDVARMLVNVERGFTKFIKEIAYESKSKYTVRLYLLISSWKDKGGFSIYTDRFKKWLNIQKKYPEFKDMYWYVIRPAYEELFEKADCWFEVAEIYKENEKQPYKLNFKVIKGKTSEEEDRQFKLRNESLYRMLTDTLHFNFEQANEIMKLHTMINYNEIVQKIMYLNEYTQTHKVRDKVKYFIKALKKEFGFSVAGEEPLIE